MIPNLLNRIIWKVPNTFCPKHSMHEYELILKTALSLGYKFLTLGELSRMEKAPDTPFIILRHDIDTDPKAALRFAQIELSHNARGTYFFRRCTWNPAVMDTLYRQNLEVGYHYEELSDYAKAKHLKQKELILPHLSDIREMFAQNLCTLRRTVQSPLTCAAAHGDFTYPTIDLGNKLFMQDRQFRSSLGIDYEAYDPELLQKYVHHISDKPAPQNYYPGSPLELIHQRESFLFLSHPRWWIPNPLESIKADITANLQRLLW